MEWIALGIAIAFMVHMLVVWIFHMRLDNQYNQNISFHGGWYVGKGQQSPDEDVLYVTGDDTETIYRGHQPHPQITSSFAEIQIRLYDPECGDCYGGSLKDELVVGRNAADGSVDIQVADSRVSRKHCRIYRQGDQILVQDLGSSNHTFVNRCPVTGVMPLMYGDKITIGSHTYEFMFTM